MLSRNERHFIGKGLELIIITRLVCTTMSEAEDQDYIMKITLVNIRIVPTLKVAFYQPISNLLEYILILIVNIGETWENPS